MTFTHKTFLDQAAYLDPLRYYQPHLYPNFLAAPPLVAEPFNPLVANTMERLVRQNYYMDAAAVHLQQQYALQQRQAAQQLQAAQQQATAAAQQSQALQRQQLQQQQLFSQQQAVANQQQQQYNGGKIREAASRSHQHQCGPSASKTSTSRRNPQQGNHGNQQGNHGNQQGNHGNQQGNQGRILISDSPDGGGSVITISSESDHGDHETVAMETAHGNNQSATSRNTTRPHHGKQHDNLHATNEVVTSQSNRNDDVTNNYDVKNDAIRNAANDRETRNLGSSQQHQSWKNKTNNQQIINLEEFGRIQQQQQMVANQHRHSNQLNHLLLPPQQQATIQIRPTQPQQHPGQYQVAKQPQSGFPPALFYPQVSDVFAQQQQQGLQQKQGIPLHPPTHHVIQQPTSYI